jgi:SNF2 family DNA or RNA helicase
VKDHRPPPYQHQARELAERASQPAWALFWDCGTGKTRAVLDLAGELYGRGEIDALLVLAPNGVHQGWVHDEIPKHLPPGVRYKALAYRGAAAGTKWQERAITALFNFSGLSILTMSYDSFVTARKKKSQPEKGKDTAKRFLQNRRCLYVLDESHLIKSPGAHRAKLVVASGQLASYRRILTGTPVANKPFDVYQQMRFIDRDFWKPHGLTSFESFKTFFGVWIQCRTKEDKPFPKCVTYRNLDRLKEILAGSASRITKEEALPDLPPKVYTKIHHDLTREQRRAYDALVDDYRVEIENGAEVTVRHKLTLLLRLQQVVCGYVPTDDGHEAPNPYVFDKNPRLDVMRDWFKAEEEQAIVYARFQRDVTALCDILGKKAVRYDGLTGDEARLEAKKRFWAGDVQFFVGNPACAGTGLNLQCARKVQYYSNSFNLVQRSQSEDRAHRSGQTGRVIIGDVVGTDTVDDNKIIPCLREKKEIADMLVGDDPRDWI